MQLQLEVKNESKPLSTKQSIGCLGVLVLVLSLAFGIAIYQQNQTRIAEEKQRVALVQKQQVENEKRTDFKKARIGRERRKGNKMPVKIALGTTKNGTPIANQGGGIFGYPGLWAVGVKGGSDVAFDNVTNGWNVTSSGSITVPVSATSGTYQAGYCTNPEEPDSPSKIYNVWEFEVVCLIVKVKPYTRLSE